MMILLGILGTVAVAGGILTFEKTVVDVTRESGASNYYTDLAKAMYEARQLKKQNKNK